MECQKNPRAGRVCRGSQVAADYPASLRSRLGKTPPRILQEATDWRKSVNPENKLYQRGNESKAGGRWPAEKHLVYNEELRAILEANCPLGKKQTGLLSSLSVQELAACGLKDGELRIGSVIGWVTFDDGWDRMYGSEHVARAVAIQVAAKIMLRKRRPKRNETDMHKQAKAKALGAVVTHFELRNPDGYKSLEHQIKERAIVTAEGLKALHRNDPTLLMMCEERVAFVYNKLQAAVQLVGAEDLKTKRGHLGELNIYDGQDQTLTAAEDRATRACKAMSSWLKSVRLTNVWTEEERARVADEQLTIQLQASQQPCAPPTLQADKRLLMTACHV